MRSDYFDLTDAFDPFHFLRDLLEIFDMFSHPSFLFLTEVKGDWFWEDVFLLKEGRVSNVLVADDFGLALGIQPCFDGVYFLLSKIKLNLAESIELSHMTISGFKELPLLITQSNESQSLLASCYNFSSIWCGSSCLWTKESEDEVDIW